MKISKGYGIVGAMLLVSILVFSFPASIAGSVSILDTGFQPIPNAILVGQSTTLVITEGPNAPHSGEEIGVWDAPAAPSVPTGCPLPDESGGVKWILKADTDNNGSFETMVTFTIPDNVPDSGLISFPFGTGQKFFEAAITEQGGADLNPDNPTGGFAWVDHTGGIATDNTLVPGRYEIITCGTEGDQQDMQGSSDFTVTDECIYRTEDQPQDPISMNTVRSKNIAKTIHAEKQIFDCALEQGGIAVRADVTIIAEIYEDMSTKSIISKQVHVITCLKEAESAEIVDCGSETPPKTTVPVGRQCVEQTTITHPQEMNSVSKGNIVKTIEAQKEVFLCELFDGTVKKVDVVIFTEIWEDLSNLQNSIVKIAFESMRCVINFQTAEVEGCQFADVSN